MRQKQKQTGKVRKKKLRFYHKTNRYFTGYLLRETPDFYTIQLTSDVAGLNAIWYAGEEVTWSKELTTIVERTTASQVRR